MQRNNRGAGVVGIVVGIVLVVVIIGGAAFFLSDVWRTRMKEGYSQFADWTPENIAKDPVNYLNFLEDQATQAMEKLKASDISVKQQRGRLQAMQEDNREKVRTGEKALEELKTEYKTAVADGSWPLEYMGAERDEDWTKRQIMSFHSEVENKKALLDKLESGLNQLNAQEQKIREQRTQVQNQLSEIRSNREMLKVQAITDDLKDQLIDMKGMLAATVTSVEDTSATISLDDLAASTATAVDEAKFEEILNQ
jgi:DNA repair exonuclease SbcCD ATPase subunit